ncbi:MAG: hypothetical protein GC149_05270 [Gammaproteobacteria bacterium]|nr:hypothetical protein [Gammaproteobacteria bacterium]
MMHDRRTRRRIPFKRPISITTDKGDKLSMMCMDFSMEGIGFLSNAPRDVGDILRVTMNIGNNGRTHVLNALGEVVHRRYKDKQFYVGMRFFRDK